jgi:6-phosphogluconolactonase
MVAVIEVLPDRERLVQDAAKHVIRLASEAVTKSGRFVIALSGGSTPQPLYVLLASERYMRLIDWSRIHLFWGDERCVPPDDPRSNYRMVRETLLDRVPVPSGNIHRIRGEADPEVAAVAYEQELRAFFGTRGEEMPPRPGFDLILLGMGEDGHTASLFPEMAALTEQVRWTMAGYVEGTSTWRITLTPVVINAAKNVLFMVSGTEKAERLRQVLEGPVQPEVLPAQVINPVDGQLLWLVDEEAGRFLKRAR